jgi:hypothetical protein
MSEVPLTKHRPVNVVHIRQSRPDSGLGFLAEVVETLQGVPSSDTLSRPLLCGEEGWRPDTHDFVAKSGTGVPRS